MHLNIIQYISMSSKGKTDYYTHPCIFPEVLNELYADTEPFPKEKLFFLTRKTQVRIHYATTSGEHCEYLIYLLPGDRCRFITINDDTYPMFEYGRSSFLTRPINLIINLIMNALE